MLWRWNLRDCLSVFCVGPVLCFWPLAVLLFVLSGSGVFCLLRVWEFCSPGLVFLCLLWPFSCMEGMFSNNMCRFRKKIETKHILQVFLDESILTYDQSSMQ